MAFAIVALTWPSVASGLPGSGCSSVGGCATGGGVGDGSPGGRAGFDRLLLRRGGPGHGLWLPAAHRARPLVRRGGAGVGGWLLRRRRRRHEDARRRQRHVQQRGGRLALGARGGTPARGRGDEQRQQEQRGVPTHGVHHDRQRPRTRGHVDRRHPPGDRVDSTPSGGPAVGATPTPPAGRCGRSCPAPRSTPPQSRHRAAEPSGRPSRGRCRCPSRAW